MPVSKYSTKCVVCGAEISNKAQDYSSQTCNADHCRAVLMLMPCVADPAKKKSHAPGFSRNKRAGSKNAIFRKLSDYVLSLASDTGNSEQHRQRALEFEVDSSDWAFGDDTMTADARGLGHPASRNLFGFLSRTRVAFRARTEQGAIWLRIRRGPEETTADAVRRSLMNNSGLEDIYSVFIAWRCYCIMQSEFIVKKLDDMPDEPGPHGNCPNCGATPLFVEVIGG